MYTVKLFDGSDGDYEKLMGLFRADPIFEEDLYEISDVLLDWSDDESYGVQALLLENMNQDLMAACLFVRDDLARPGVYTAWWIGVAEAWKRQGVGGLLMGEVEQKVTDFDGDLLVVHTGDTPRYQPMCQFLEALGYTCGGRIPTYYKKDEGLVLYYKELS